MSRILNILGFSHDSSRASDHPLTGQTVAGRSDWWTKAFSGAAAHKWTGELLKLLRMHGRLRRILQLEPSLRLLEFQGVTLAQHGTTIGFIRLIKAWIKGDFDPVARNHGIQRLRLSVDKREVIWSHPDVSGRIIENDEVTRRLQAHAQEIRREVLGILVSLRTFPDSDSLTNPSGLWSYLPFYDKSGRPIDSAHTACPRISALLGSLDLNLTFGFAFISVLDPNTKIAAHRGSTSLRQRYHLGLFIPQGADSRIRVGDRWLRWQEGKAFGFNDSEEHEVVHTSPERRAILIVDLWAAGLPSAVKAALQRYPEVLSYAVLQSAVPVAALHD